VTIARFRAGLWPAATGLDRLGAGAVRPAGMGWLGVIALDGMEVKAAASVAANGNAEALRQYSPVRRAGPPAGWEEIAFHRSR
jgi:hypothetical protein